MLQSSTGSTGRCCETPIDPVPCMMRPRHIRNMLECSRSMLSGALFLLGDSSNKTDLAYWSSRESSGLTAFRGNITYGAYSVSKWLNHPSEAYLTEPIRSKPQSNCLRRHLHHSSSCLLCLLVFHILRNSPTPLRHRSPSRGHLLSPRGRGEWLPVPGGLQWEHRGLAESPLLHRQLRCGDWAARGCWSSKLFSVPPQQPG